MTTNSHLTLVTCSISMHFSPEDVESAIRLLLSEVGCTQAKPGCQTCAVARDAVEEGRIQYTETWDSESAFRRHVRSQDFRRVLVAMDMACEEPNVIVGNLSGRSGIAYLRELQDGAESGG